MAFKIGFFLVPVFQATNYSVGTLAGGVAGISWPTITFTRTLCMLNLHFERAIEFRLQRNFNFTSRCPSMFHQHQVAQVFHRNEYRSCASGACFSKVPKHFGRISGDLILFVSSNEGVSRHETLRLF